MYVKIMITSYKYGEFKEINFKQNLYNDIERIFIEDNKNKIMVWEKSEGYGKFDIYNKWLEELQMLTTSSK